MKLFLKRHAPLFYSLGAMLVLYTPWLNRGMVNIEWSYPLAGKALAFPDQIQLMDAYWESGQANPLGYAVFDGMSQRIFFWSNATWVSRVPSLIGIALVIIWGWFALNKNNKFSNFYFYSWSTLIILCPLLISYSTQGTPDVLPVGILLISFTFIETYKRSARVKFLFFGSILFGISSAIKYISPYFVGFYIFTFTFKRGVSAIRRIRDLLICGILSAGVLSSEVVFKYLRFDVFLTNRLEEMGPDFLDFNNWILTLSKYLSFLGIFSGFLPLIFFLMHKNLGIQNLRKGLLRCVAFGFGWAAGKPLGVGELDFGLVLPISDYFVRLFVAAGFANAVALLVLIFKSFRTGDFQEKSLIVGLTPYLILISASRPTQRYLIYALPIVLFFLIKSMVLFSRKLQVVAVGSTAVVFAVVSFVGMSYLRSQGDASENMAVWVENNQLISQTSAGAIYPHAGQHFWGVKVTQIRYEVIAVSPEGESQIKERILHREPMKVLGKVTRVYVLREIPALP